MTTNDDGGTAFPQSIAVGPSGDVYVAWRDAPDAEGMSLRDYFAAQALTGVIGSGDFLSPEGLFTGRGASVMADAAYMLADAMITRRGQS